MSINSLPKAYAEFKPLVDAIKAGGNSEDFIGSGAESSVWRGILNDNEYAIKLTNPLSIRDRPRDVPRATQAKINSGTLGLGIPGIEQIQAGSIDEGVIIYDLAKGIPLSKLSLEDVRAISDDQLWLLDATITEAIAAGIEFDAWNTSGTNAFFDPIEGFTLIDYWVRKEMSPEKAYMFALRSLGTVGVRLTSLRK